MISWERCPTYGISSFSISSGSRKMTESIPKSIKPQRSLREWCKERGLDLFITLGGMVAVLLATVYLHFWAPPSLTKNTKVVVIPQGKSFHEIARILEDQGIIRDRRSFYLLARIEGALSKVKAGEYEVHTRMTPGAVLSKLLRGRSFSTRSSFRRVTIFTRLEIFWNRPKSVPKSYSWKRCKTRN